MATPVIMPKQGNSVESCLIVEWKKQIGDTVNEGEILLEVETDKAVIEVESPASGTLLELYFSEDDEVPVQTTIAMIGEAGEQVEKQEALEQPPKPVQKDTSSSTVQSLNQEQKVGTRAPQDHLKISPRARSLAGASDISTSGISGTGPHGRIIERDIQEILKSASAQGAESLLAIATHNLDNATAIPLSSVRKRIAKRMLESLQTTAQLTLSSSADARELLHYRKQLKQSPESLGGRDISINDLMHFAVSRALKEHPNLNATFEQDSLFEHHNVNLGFAVDTPRGLLVPVIQKADELPLKQLSKRAKNLAKQAQDGRIAPDDLQGASFTVSNLGQFGIESFTPVLNPPQVAILGVGGVNLKAVQVEDEVKHIPHISLSLTINHQVVDGAPAARFLQTLSSYIADLSNLLFL